MIKWFENQTLLNNKNLNVVSKLWQMKKDNSLLQIW